MCALGIGLGLRYRVRNQVAAGAARPLVATIGADGLSLSLVFPVVMDIGTGAAGFSVSGQAPANGSVSAVYDSGDGTDTLEFILASEIYATETIKLAFVQPGTGVGDGLNFLPSFSNFTVVNNSAIGTGILRDGNNLPVPDGNARAIPIIIS